MHVKILTKEIAENFINDANSVSLDEFTKIDDDAAEILSNSYPSEGEEGLCMPHLATLSDASAESFSKCKIWEFSGLTELRDSPEFLGLISNECLDIYFRKLTFIGDQAAEIISQRGTQIFLDGRFTLSDAAAKSLSKCKDSVDLLGLTQLTDSPGHLALAEILDERTHEFGLEEKYGEWVGPKTGINCGLWGIIQDGIYLNSLVHVTDAVMEILSGKKVNLCLPSLTSISDRAAESLSNFKGEVLFLN